MVLAVTADANRDTVALLGRLSGGDASAADALYLRIYEELHRIAAHMMAKERGDHTLQATALLNEAWVRLAGGAVPHANDRNHFVRLAARAMRHVLVDHARRKSAGKRSAPGIRELPIDLAAAWEHKTDDLLALNDALEQLAERDENLVRLVEFRFFSGLTLVESGVLLGMTERQAGLAWQFARAWLRRELSKGDRGDDAVV